MKAIRLIAAGTLVLGLAACGAAYAQTSSTSSTSNVVQDAFTGQSATLTWAPFNGACLTAGNNSGSVPACAGLAYYGSQTQEGLINNADQVNYGALRLTNAADDENGAIISTTPFSSSAGIQVTFTTYTYGGDNAGGHGADGIGFYLLNGGDAANVIAASANPNNNGSTNKWTLGAWGGSLGYSCSNTNTPYNGMTDAYLGLGMDEFGNFLNAGDNTYSGALNAANATGSTGVTTGPVSGLTGGGGPEYQPGRIGLRGYGNINLLSLQAVNPNASASDVQATCQNGGTYTYNTGQYTTTSTTTYSYTYQQNNGFGGFGGGGTTTVNYSGTLYSKSGNNKYSAAGTTSSSSDGYTGTGQAYGQISSLFGNNYVAITITPNTTTTQTPITATATFADYAAIPNAYVNLPSNTPLANEGQTSRAGATPVSYKLTVTETGMLSLAYSWNGGNYQPVITNQSIQQSNGTMPSSFLFGFGGSTGGDDNVHEITCFQAIPATQTASSAGINVQQTSPISSSTQVYLAYYHTTNWWGQIEAVALTGNADGSVSFGTVNWDASCVLTGGPCTSTGNSNNVAAQGPGSRNLVTWSGTAGIPFTWGRLTTTEQAWLNAGDNLGSDRTGYLQGYRTNEINSQGQGEFRARTSVLGDVIDSSPVWVGPPSTDYPDTWQDLTNSKDPLNENLSNPQTYSQFMTAEATRLNVVYEGANDGFMHAFWAGETNSQGVYVNSDNNGQELMAYMPQAVLQTIHSTTAALDYSSQSYAHNYFVDATPGTGDLFYSGLWHTWLVSGLGSGGNAIFAFDITAPSTTMGSGNILGEWSNSSNSPLTCYGDTTSNPCMNHLGQTFGTPQIRRLHNGEWGVIFGNGFNNSIGDAGIYVMTINNSGKVDQTYYLSTGVGSPSNAQGPNGIAYVTPVDLDGDHITDYVYAGDYYGNVWRFDLTSATPTSWGVTTYTNTTNGALFSTPSTPYQTKVGTNTVNATTYQPITTSVLALSVAPSAGASSARVLIEFGTGAVQPQSLTSTAVYATGPQALYGIWDWMLGTSGTAGANYAGLSGTSVPKAKTPITTATLEPQTATTDTVMVNGTSESYETVTANTICFVGQSCNNSSGKTVAGTMYGWYLELTNATGVTVGVNASGSPNQTEQVVYNPIEEVGAFVVNTTIPSNDSPLTCTTADNTGFTMALNPATGGAFAESFFPDPATGSFTTIVGISGSGLGGTGSGSFITHNGKTSYLTQAQPQPQSTLVNPQNMANGNRLTWLQLH